MNRERYWQLRYWHWHVLMWSCHTKIMAAVSMVSTSQLINILTKHNRKHWLTGSVSASPARELNLTRLGLLCWMQCFYYFSDFLSTPYFNYIDCTWKLAKLLKFPIYSPQHEIWAKENVPQIIIESWIRRSTCSYWPLTPPSRVSWVLLLSDTDLGYHQSELGAL